MLNVPILITRALAIFTISPPSSAPFDMIGDAPIANAAFAQSVTVTKLVMQKVKGEISLTFFKASVNPFNIFFTFSVSLIIISSVILKPLKS